MSMWFCTDHWLTNGQCCEKATTPVIFELNQSIDEIINDLDDAYLITKNSSTGNFAEEI